MKYLALLLLLPSCGILAQAATPIAIDAAKLLVQSVVAYAKTKGLETDRVNCEEEWDPDDGELLILSHDGKIYELE